MPRPGLDHDTLKRETLLHLATSPEGLSSPQLRERLSVRVSQPTLSRLLSELRAGARVEQIGAARATRYVLAQGALGRTRLRSRLLHRAVAERLIHDANLSERARSRLQRLREVNPSASRYHVVWQDLLDGDPIDLLRVLSEPSERADQLRKESPFSTLLPRAEREKLLASMSS